MSRHRSLISATVIVALATVSSACASSGALSHYPAPVVRVNDRAYRTGFDEGRDEGERDARRRLAYDYARHDEFRDADRGYRGGDHQAPARYFWAISCDVKPIGSPV